MSVLSAFSSSVIAMMSQSHALYTIGNNIANMTTGGFKRTETNFATLVSKTMDKQSDLGGVRPKDFSRIDRQGLLVTGSNDLDVAINGDGFFILNTMVDGSGDTLYSRDGSFELRTGADTTAIADDGSTITVEEGYLVDKNGYFVQGWSADAATGAFPTTGATSSLRIDQFAFSNSGIATTMAKLGINLPSSDTPPLAQVDKVTLVGTPEATDTYSVTVGGDTVTYIVQPADTTQADIRDGLIARINGDAIVGARVTATIGGDDALLLTANVPGGTFVASTTAFNGGAAANSSTSLTVLAAEAATSHQRNIDIFDSNGVRQSVPINFTKTATNQWQMTTTTSRDTVAQVDTIALVGVVEANDTYSVNVDGDTVTYTVQLADTTLADVRDGLIAKINADGVVGAKVTAAPSGTAALTLTAASAGTAFTATPAAANGGATADNTATLTNTTANVTDTVTSSPISLTFDSTGKITTTSPISLPLTFAGGGTATVAFDVSDFTQFAGDFISLNYSKNGNSAADMRSLRFNGVGEIVANFADSTFRAIYKLPLAVFSNPNGMGRSNGNTFVETTESGIARVVSAGNNGFALFVPGALEKSNVNVADEFSRMIMTQNAYNSAATVFKTVDEMTIIARDLKR